MSKGIEADILFNPPANYPHPSAMLWQGREMNKGDASLFLHYLKNDYST